MPLPLYQRQRMAFSICTYNSALRDLQFRSFIVLSPGFAGTSSCNRLNSKRIAEKVLRFAPTIPVATGTGFETQRQEGTKPLYYFVPLCLCVLVS